MNSYLLHGASYASTPAMIHRGELDLKHNSNPVLTCEGECSNVDVTWTRHSLVSETWDRELLAFRQDYACGCCGEQRQFGLCVTRQTVEGARN